MTRDSRRPNDARWAANVVRLSWREARCDNSKTMKFLGSETAPDTSSAVDGPLYRALAVGDLPGAWLLARPLLEPGQAERLAAPAAFNCALCLFLIGEYERALGPLKRAEQSLSTSAGLDTAERKLFIQALSVSDAALLPVDPEGGAGMECHVLIRVRWLTALCLLRLDRQQEAAPILRYLAQYQIEVRCEEPG